MSRKLPEELVPVLAKLGHHWPEADEEGLRRAAGVWREFGAEAERLSRRGGDSAQRVVGENSGHAVDAFAEHWRGFAGGGRGQLDDAQSAAESVAKAFDAAATAADHCKAEIIAVLTPLAEEFRTAEAAEAKAKAAPAAGVIGAAAKIAVTAIAEIGEAIEIEAAKLRVGALLEELGRQMKHSLETALKEPAVTTLERIAQGGGPADLRTAGATVTGVSVVAGVGAGGGAALGGIRTLSAAVGPDGQVLLDKSGNPVLVGPDGRRVHGIDGVSVALGADGQPLLGPDGRAVVVGADGRPVEGVAVGLDGKPLTDATGKPIVVGADGKLGASGLSVAVDANGNPITGIDGRPELLGADGLPLAGTDSAPERSGLPGAPGAAGLPGAQGGTGPVVRTAAVDAGVRLPVDPAPVAAADPGAGSGSGSGDGSGIQYGPTHRRSGAVQYVEPGGYDTSSGGDPAPLRVGPVSVHTDSVAVAPPANWTESGGSAGYSDAPSTPVGSSGSGGGSVWRSDPVTSGGLGGGGLGGGGVVSGGFATGPVGAPAAGPVAAGPVAAAPVSGGPTLAPVGGQAGSPGVPGASGAAAAPGAPGTPGAVGQPVGAVVGAVLPGQGPGAVARTPAGSPTSGSPTPGANPGPGGAVPFRAFAENAGPRRGPDGLGYGQAEAQGGWGAPVGPGQVAAVYLVARSYGRRSPVPPGEAAPVRAIADSRPYGLPGGLGQVDPAHQREVVRRAPRTPDGAVVPHPDPLVGDLAGDWADGLNGGGHREPGRANNCLDVALSAVDTFAGLPSCAAPRLPDGPAGERAGRDRAERELGTQFRDVGDGLGALGRLAEVLLRSGHGAQAVLLTVDGYGRSHTWNAVNHGGSVSYLDYQLGRQASTPLYSADHGLWAIAVDAEVRPIDLADVQLPAAVPKSTPAADPAPPAADPAPPAADPAPPVAVSAPEPPVVVEPAPPRSRLTIHRAGAANTSTRSANR